MAALASLMNYMIKEKNAGKIVFFAGRGILDYGLKGRKNSRLQRILNITYPLLLTYLIETSSRLHLIRNGSVTSPIVGQRKAGFT